MRDSQEAEIKSEIERISRDIDAIIKKLEEHCPKEQEDRLSEVPKNA